MVQTGAPDFQDLTQWADTEFFNGHAAGNNTGGVDVGIFNVSQWAFLQVNVFAAFVDCRIDFWFGSDLTVTSPIEQRRVFVSAGAAQGSLMVIPCSSLFVRVIISTAGVTADAIQLALSPSNRAGPSFTAQIPTNLIERLNVNVNAGATDTVTFAYCFGGPAHVVFSTALATGTVRLNWLDEVGTVHPFWRFTFPVAASGFFASPVMIPPAIVQLTVLNTTGAAGVYSAFVMPDAFRSDS